MCKKILFIAFAALGMCFLAMSCSKVKDMSERLDSLENRVGAIETQLTKMNSDINALSKAVSALQENLYIYKVNDLPEGMEFIFSDGSRATIYNGADGDEGQAAPVIGVRIQEGVYYWTLTYNGQTEWLTDDQGRMMRVTGEKGDKGEDGVTPQMGVDNDGYWTVSYDGGTTWNRILVGGQPVQAKGEKGDSWFTNVEVFEKDGYVKFSLASGETITLPFKSELDKLVARIQSIEVVPVNSDGSVGILKKDVQVKFEVRPASVIQSLIEKGVSVFLFQTVKTNAVTKASIFDTVSVTNAVMDEDSLLVLTVSGNEMPDDFFAKTQSYNARLRIADGNTDKASAYFPLMPRSEKVIWEGNFVCSDWNGNQDLAYGAFDWKTVSAGDVLIFHLIPDLSAVYSVISLRNGNMWGSLPNPPIPSSYDISGDTLEVEMTQNVLDDLNANYGLVITGNGFTLTKITLTH